MKTNPNLWITTDWVIKFNGKLEPAMMGFDEGEYSAFTSLISEYILQCQNLITDYCNTDFNLPVPRTVQNVLLRLVSNLIGISLEHRDFPVNNVRDLKLSGYTDEIFTDNLKRDLAPYIKEGGVTPVPGAKGAVDMFAITGKKKRRLF